MRAVFARLADLGCKPRPVAKVVGRTRQAVEQYLSGKSSPSAVVAESLARALGVSADELRGGAVTAERVEDLARRIRAAGDGPVAPPVEARAVAPSIPAATSPDLGRLVMRLAERLGEPDPVFAALARANANAPPDASVEWWFDRLAEAHAAHAPAVTLPAKPPSAPPVSITDPGRASPPPEPPPAPSPTGPTKTESSRPKAPGKAAKRRSL